jgi:PAS domain S-box-containing protein
MKAPHLKLSLIARLKPPKSASLETQQALDEVSAPAIAVAARRRVPSDAPESTEVPFSFEEVFFSRTNEKGHILFGNAVFQRTSLYPWEELVGRPHNIVRHPDMPRSIFWLLWTTIKKGEPIGAYVKNKAKDGRHYWVLALVTPIDGGYLSVRVKPSSSFFALAKQEYATLTAAENDLHLQPSEGAQRLLAKLAERGFENYESFMAASLCAEMKARGERLGRPPIAGALQFEGLSKEAAELLEQSRLVYAAYASHRNVPLNLRVQAAKLGRAGAPIAVISLSYDTLSAAINRMMAEFLVSAKQLFTAINKGLFLYGVAQIQREMCGLFEAECSSSGNAATNEIALLEKQRGSYEAMAAAGLCAIAAEAERFERFCRDLKRSASGLETTHIMGKVEAARIDEVDAAALNELLGDLERYQIAMAEGMEKMLAMSQTIRRNTLDFMQAVRA